MVLHSRAAADVAEDEDDDSRLIVGVCAARGGSCGLGPCGKEEEEGRQGERGDQYGCCVLEYGVHDGGLGGEGLEAAKHLSRIVGVGGECGEAGGMK